MNWDDFNNFGPDEFRCRCGCGVVEMDPVFISVLQEIRDEMAIPLSISSGYRCPKHNSNVSSTGETGPHTTGKAADIAVRGADAWALQRVAAKYPEIRGLGFKQHGGGRFVHLDILTGPSRPAIWSYP
tara:strand:- start:6209 stop:6592 length:384 start_codon:yes stop_codon:yes gene_type:complete